VKRVLLVALLGLTVAGTATAAGSTNDPYVARQWYLGRDHALDTLDAAKQLFTVRVAVIDSGVELNHPELKNRVVAHRSFVGGTVADTIGHGTFVAGEIAAIADNNAGIAGLAPPARLVVAKVVRDDGTIPPKAEAQAIRWAVRQGARVVNLSLGSTRDPSDPDVDGFSPVEQRAVEYAVRHGALVVAAAGNGNDAPQKLPGSLPARARGRRLRPSRRRAELFEPRRPPRRLGCARDGHLLALPARANGGVRGVRRAGLLELRHQGVPPRRRHLVRGPAGRCGRGAALR
jgi:subtilisin family serine protease